MPPELYMTQSNMILSMLIPSAGSLGDAIDIYLQSLIEEIKELWEISVRHLMHQLDVISNFMQLYFGQLTIFLLMECCLDGVLREN